MVAYLSLLMKPVKSFIEKGHGCGTAMSAFYNLEAESFRRKLLMLVISRSSFAPGMAP